MTPEQIQELEALKAALKQHIEEAEKATPGPWTNDPLELCLVEEVSKSNGQPVAQAQARQPLAAGKRGHGAGAGDENGVGLPLGIRLACEIALAGIEALEEDCKNPFYYWPKEARTRLLFILKLWKGGNP